MAGEAGRHCPLMQTGRAHASRVKGVPCVAALAEPAIMGRGRPVTLWTTNARPGRTVAGNFLDLSNRKIYDCGHLTIMEVNHLKWKRGKLIQ